MAYLGWGSTEVRGSSEVRGSTPALVKGSTASYPSRACPSPAHKTRTYTIVLISCRTTSFCAGAQLPHQ